MAVVTAIKNQAASGLVAADLQEAKRVLETEAAALNTLAEHIGAEFSRAVGLILNCQGRVIISGMGKSGHIGAKMAATFASTGTPAFFIHPGEASHGDLGMITKSDVVLAISHSGESKELSDIIFYCKRYNIPLLGLTGKESSTLGQAADVVLNDLVTEEACPNNLAPTTSTTAALALGDALAVALMHRRGFVAEDFARFHPGGSLGKQLAKVADIMIAGDAVPLANITDDMNTIIQVLRDTNKGSVGIIDAAGVLKGVITDGDLKRHMSVDIFTKKAADIMSSSPKTVNVDALAVSAMQDMQLKTNRFISALYVIDNAGKPVGLFRLHECMAAGLV